MSAPSPMTLSLLLELNRPVAPYALDRRCVADVAKCLRCPARNGRDENRVNETLKCRCLDAVALAAGADDQGGGIEQRKGLRGHEDAVVGWPVPGEIDHRIGAGGFSG